MQYAQFAADKFAGTEPIDDAAIKAYYDKNGDRFMTTESVALEYAELRLEQLATQVAPTEADLQKLYDENRAMYVLDERRRARHIVIAVNDDDDAGALKQAETVARRSARRQGFRRARQEVFERRHRERWRRSRLRAEAGFPGPLGDTLFAMNVGDVSAPVKSQFGYHILKLEEIQAGEAKPFADVRAELDSQYRQDRAAELFGERQER